MPAPMARSRTGRSTRITATACSRSRRLCCLRFSVSRPFPRHSIPPAGEGNGADRAIRRAREAPKSYGEAFRDKKPFDSSRGGPLKGRCEVESESAAIEGAAAERRGGRVLISHSLLRTHCRNRQWVFYLPTRRTAPV